MFVMRTKTYLKNPTCFLYVCACAVLIGVVSGCLLTVHIQTQHQQARRKHTHTGKPHILLYNSQYPILPRFENYNMDVVYCRKHTAT